MPSSSDEEIHPLLRTQAADVAAGILKAASGPLDIIFPHFGSKVVDALISQVFPGREERFARFLTDLSRRLRALERRVDEHPSWWSPAKQALFEDGARVAVRALSDQRIGEIAHLVAEGLSSDDRDALDNLRLLAIIEQINDDDVIELIGFSQAGFDPVWRAKHQAILDPLKHIREANEKLGPIPLEELPREDPGDYMEVRRLGIMQDLRQQRLIALGLLKRDQEIRIIEGSPKARARLGPIQLTALGDFILQRMGLK